MTKARLLLLLSTAAISSAARAGAYGPFSPEENYVVALHTCKGTLKVRQVNPPLGTVDFSRAGDEARLRVTMVGTSHYEAQVLSLGAPSSTSVEVPVQATMPMDVGLDDAICDDLNGDGVTDFVVNLWGHGNGLGAAFYNRLIALSSSGRYRFWVVPTMNPSAQDFVTFGKLKPLVMVTTDFVRKRGNRPSEDRSYFVYDLWAYHGGEVVSANSIDSRFPKWVRFTTTPNWRPAISVTEDERRSRGIPPLTEAVP